MIGEAWEDIKPHVEDSIRSGEFGMTREEYNKQRKIKAYVKRHADLHRWVGGGGIDMRGLMVDCINALDLCTSDVPLVRTIVQEHLR